MRSGHCERRSNTSANESESNVLRRVVAFKVETTDRVMGSPATGGESGRARPSQARRERRLALMRRRARAAPGARRSPGRPARGGPPPRAASKVVAGKRGGDPWQHVQVFSPFYFFRIFSYFFLNFSTSRPRDPHLPLAAVNGGAAGLGGESSLFHLVRVL